MHKLIEAYQKANVFGREHAMQLSVLSEGHIEYRMEIQEKHLALPGAAHGGMIAAMMDAILGVAALSATAPLGKVVATVEFKINFLSPAAPRDTLIGIGKVLQQGNRLLFCQGEIRNNKGLIATGNGTFNAYPVEKSGLPIDQ